MNWKINQAGYGWLSLGNYFGYSTVLIKRRDAGRQGASFSKLQVALHENVVGLVEAFYDGISTHFVYNYHGFAVNLAQVGLTPTLELSEKDLASICRSVLRGLEYIHEQLHIVHGGVNCDNIILCSDGAIKIGKLCTTLSFMDGTLSPLANIGDSMINDGPTSMDLDREDVGSLLLQLGDSHGYVKNPEEIPRKAACRLSKYATHFIEHIGSSSYSYIFEVWLLFNII